MARDRVLNVGEAPLELADALANRRPHLRETLGAEEEQNDHQYEHELGKADVLHGNLLKDRDVATPTAHVLREVYTGRKPTPHHRICR